MLDGCYTRLLRTALNVSWKAHMTNQDLYGDLPKVSEKIRKRRLQFAGHCMRRTGQVITDVLLWKPLHGKRSVGRPITTYVNLLCQDTGLKPVELRTCMEDRSVWRAITNVPRKLPLMMMMMMMMIARTNLSIYTTTTHIFVLCRKCRMTVILIRSCFAKSSSTISMYILHSFHC